MISLFAFPGILYIFPRIGILPQGIVTLAKYCSWIGSLLLVLLFWRSCIILSITNIFIWLLTGLSVISFLWSDFPSVTFLNAIEVLMMTLFSLYFATRFCLEEQIKLISTTLFIGAILSIFVAVIFPNFGRHIEGDLIGAWKGIYWQKNILGSMMVLSSITFYTLPKQTSSFYRYLGLSIALGLILFSTSKTSLVLYFISMSIMIFYQKFRWRGKISVVLVDIGILVFGCVLLLVSTFWVELLTELGKDPTLTGRTPLWNVMLNRLMDRPLFGYGIGGFWAPGSQYAIEAGKAVGTGWIAPSGHNGYMDILVDLGLVGFSLFLIIYCITFIKAFRIAYSSNKKEDLWYLTYITFLALNSLTETFFLRPGIHWMLFITVAFSVNKKIREY
ncbi:hypothetical protein IJ00_17190 [Calothrix sp. 336/3]|nr:hypothetical protein IJ00_17190 [Calothrix sp. 336/3]